MRPLLCGVAREWSSVTLAVVLCLVSVTAAAVLQAPDRVDSQGDELRRVLDSGAYEEAERQAAAWQELAEAQHGPESVEAARASDFFVEALLQNGKAGAPATLALATHVVRVKEANQQVDQLDLTRSLHNLAAVHTARGEFKEAVPLHERALSIRRRLLSPNSPEIADSLDYLALPLILADRFREAQPKTEESLRMRRSASGQSDRSLLALARTLEVIALLHRRDGSYAAARAPIDEALAIRGRLAPDHPSTASALLLRGDLLLLAGDPHGAQRVWAEGLALGERSLRHEHPTISLLLERLSIAAWSLGDLTTARELVERALPIARAWLPPCHRDLSALLIHFAIVVEDEGDYAQAQRLFAQALATTERCLGPNNQLTVTVIHNQANLAWAMGDRTKAANLEQRAVRKWSASLGPNHPFVARGLDTLADIVEDDGQLVRARALYQQALRIRQETLSGVPPDIARTLANLARVDSNSGRASLALRRINQAIDICRTPGAADNPNLLGRVFGIRGTIDMRGGDFKAARASFSEALANQERRYSHAHPLSAIERASVAWADFALGAYDSALSSALQAEQESRGQLRFTLRYLPERQALKYAAFAYAPPNRTRGLDVALSMVADKSVRDPAAVLDAVFQSRGVVLDELAARSASAAVTDPRFVSLKAALVAARQRFAYLMLRSLQGESVRPALLDEAREQREEAERALAEGSVAARGELTGAPIGLEEIRHALPANSALVSYVRYDRLSVTSSKSGTGIRTLPSYIGFVVRSDSTSVMAVPIGSAASLDMMVNSWRNEAGGRSIAAGVSPSEAERAYRRTGARLRHEIWDPLRDALRDVSQVFVVPDGALNLVSFAALPSGRSQYLIEGSAAIHYLSTERDLVSGDLTSTGRGLLAVGGPAFDERLPGARSTATAASRSSRSVSATRSPAVASALTKTRGSGCESLGSLRFEALPQSGPEAEDVARIWRLAAARGDGGAPTALDGVIVMTGRAAKENAVKQEIAGRQVVHLATHGFFLGSSCKPGVPHTRAVGALAPASSRAAVVEEDPLLLAGLAFAGANHHSEAGPGQDNGVLTAEEVAGLNLQGTEWAVLSACDTGIGEIRAGEGVFGLRRAFQIAGARTVIMSLWSVEDQSARLWMRTLYESRFQKGLSTAGAVRAAGLRVLRDRRAHGQSTHPFYWAAFVAAGDWR